MSSPRKRSGAAAAVMLAFAANAASAATITTTASYALTGTDTTPQLLSLSLFDATLGTLNSATLSFAGSLVSSSQVNNASAALNLTNVTVSLFGDLAATRVGSATGLPTGVDLVAPDSFLGSRTFTILGPLAQTTTGPFTLTIPAAANTFSITGASVLQSLIGAGTFGYSFASSTSASVPARFTSVSLTPSSQSSMTMTMMYDYTPGVVTQVPEPGTGLLLMAGLGALVIGRRRPVARG